MRRWGSELQQLRKIVQIRTLQAFAAETEAREQDRALRDAEKQSRQAADHRDVVRSSWEEFLGGFTFEPRLLNAWSGLVRESEDAVVEAASAAAQAEIACERARDDWRVALLRRDQADGIADECAGELRKRSEEAALTRATEHHMAKRRYG